MRGGPPLALGPKALSRTWVESSTRVMHWLINSKILTMLWRTCWASGLLSSLIWCTCSGYHRGLPEGFLPASTHRDWNQRPGNVSFYFFIMPQNQLKTGGNPRENPRKNLRVALRMEHWPLIRPEVVFIGKNEKCWLFPLII